MVDARYWDDRARELRGLAYILRSDGGYDEWPPRLERIAEEMETDDDKRQSDG